MEKSRVIIRYKQVATGESPRAPLDAWQCIVQETAYREDGMAYPCVVAIAENKDKRVLTRWAIREGYKAREVQELDLTPNQAPLF